MSPGCPLLQSGRLGGWLSASIGKPPLPGFALNLIVVTKVRLESAECHKGRPDTASRGVMRAWRLAAGSGNMETWTGPQRHAWFLGVAPERHTTPSLPPPSTAQEKMHGKGRSTSPALASQRQALVMDESSCGPMLVPKVSKRCVSSDPCY